MTHASCELCGTTCMLLHYLPPDCCVRMQIPKEEFTKKGKPPAPHTCSSLDFHYNVSNNIFQIWLPGARWPAFIPSRSFTGLTWVRERCCNRHPTAGSLCPLTQSLEYIAVHCHGNSGGGRWKGLSRVTALTRVWTLRWPWGEGKGRNMVKWTGVSPEKVNSVSHVW